MTEKGRALWVLALLSPVVAELCSGSSPPLEFFNPVSFALLLGLYGAGVLIVRELSVIWNLGWISVIVMGAAYGILEEGVAVKSFFDPEWMDLGGLGVYGRFLDTNLVWATWLTIFHSAVSITLPILMVSLLYPHFVAERFLTRKGFIIVMVILFLDVLTCATILNDYAPSTPMYILAILAVFGLVLYAKQIPKSFMLPIRATPTWAPSLFFMTGFLFLLSSFIVSSSFSGTSIPPIVPIVMLLLISFTIIMLIREYMGRAENRAHKAYLASGMLFLWVVFGFVLEFNGYLGMSVVAVVTLLFIIDFTRWSEGKRVFVFHVGWLLYGKK